MEHLNGIKVGRLGTQTVVQSKINNQLRPTLVKFGSTLLNPGTGTIQAIDEPRFTRWCLVDSRIR